MEDVLEEEKRFPLTTQAAILKDAAILVQKESKHLREERKKIDEDRNFIISEFDRLEALRVSILNERVKLVEEKLMYEKTALKLRNASIRSGSLKLFPLTVDNTAVVSASNLPVVSEIGDVLRSSSAPPSSGGSLEPASILKQPQSKSTPSITITANGKTSKKRDSPH